MEPEGADLNERINVRGKIEALQATLAEREKRYEERFKAQEQAIEKAESANERRLDLLNEFRSQSVDEQAKFVTQEYFDAIVERLIKVEAFLGKLLVIVPIVTLLMPLITGILVYLLTRHAVPINNNK